MKTDHTVEVEIDGITYRGTYVSVGACVTLYYKDFAPRDLTLRHGQLAVSAARWHLEQMIRGAISRDEPV